MENYYSSINKNSLVDSRGITYYDFVATLTPKYHVVWLQLLSGHLALITVCRAIILMGIYYPQWWPLLIPFSAFLIGYILAYIMLFFHEAAHYNLARHRKLNDFLTNVFIGVLFGQNIKDYRPIHWGHHRLHGEPNDPEHAYFDPLNIKFLVESIFGIYPVKVLKDRKKRLRELAQPSELSPYESKILLILGIILNSSLLGWGVFQGYWYFSLSWLMGMIIVFPFFAALRPILEHRDEHARSNINYFKVPHGIVNRLFGDGPVASTLGGAGFNRHLLHHIEPKVPYTRLKEFERYLSDTQFAKEIKSHQTTYLKTFLNLLDI